MRRVFVPIGRRTFVRIATAGVAAAALPTCGAQSTTEEVENLVVGAGFGGAITAHRLAMAGHTSVVLERGRRWTVETPGDDVFSNMGLSGEDAYDRRSAWFSTRPPLPGLTGRPLAPFAGILERIPGDGIDVVCAAGVGGGSLVYSGMMVRPPADLFEALFPPEITAASMDPYFERVREMMMPAAMPDAILALPQWTSSRVFIDQAMRAGYEVERLLCAFDWSLAEAEARGELPPQLVRGHYIFGLNSGAKRSLDRNYLRFAEDSGRCDVRPLHWVQSVSRSTRGWTVEYDRIDEEGRVIASSAIAARRLFLCAGTANTNGLLARARDERTIDGLPDSLGEGFANNGQHIRARRDVGVDTGAFQAGPASIMLFDRAAPIAMENGPAPIGSELQLLIGTGQGIPSGRGTLSWDPTNERPLPTWSASHDAEATAHTDAVVRRLNEINGGSDATALFGLGTSVTFHPLGGCVLGQTTDLAGRVRGQERLYVIDGSLVPGCTPLSNPFWTISALAERCIEAIVREDLGR